MYLGWYDPDKKKSSRTKLEEAAARYREKWARKPLVALVNESDAPAILAGNAVVPGLTVRVVHHVAPNTFFVGEDDEPTGAREAA